MLLYCKGHIQMINNDSIIIVKTKQYSEQNGKIPSNTIRIRITIYHTYQLLYCKEYIQKISNDSTINVETKNNRINKMTKFHSLKFELTLRYITLTDYYIGKNTFR